MDAFVTKLDKFGNDLEYSTYLGGSAADGGHGIAVDWLGNAYVTGYTTSSDFPTTELPYQGSLAGEQDAFVTKLKPDGKKPSYSTYLGGSADDSGHGIAVGLSENPHVTGSTASNDFPPSPESSYQEKLVGKIDAFVIRMAGEEKSNKGNIGGRVYIFGDDVTAGATVKLKDIITGEQERRITDIDGLFFFINLESGTYQLKAKKGKKKSETMLITLTNEHPNEAVTLVLK